MHMHQLEVGAVLELPTLYKFVLLLVYVWQASCTERTLAGLPGCDQCELQ